MKNIIKTYLANIRNTPDYESKTIEELHEISQYPGNLACFRVLCHRHDIKFKKGFRGDAKKVNKGIAEGVDFANMNVHEIKIAVNYPGTLDGLANVLRRRSQSYIDTASEDKFQALKIKDELIAKINALGDTANLRPNEILEKIDFDILNAAQFLRKLGVPYKPLTRKN